MQFSWLFTFLGAFMLFFTYTAQADAPKAPPLPDYERLRLENGKDMHHSYWDNDEWSSDDWISMRGSIDYVMQDLHRGGILVGQSERNGNPVLEVGEGFMNLSNTDKRRVAAFVDHAYGLTSSLEKGMFFIYYERTDTPIGIYTERGLQIQ